MFYFDPTYFMLIPALLLAAYAQYKVKSTFNKYSKKYASKNITGAEVAKELLRANNINDVQVENVNGNLTDHYDPKGKKVRLSSNVHSSNSLAAISVAAHETGHAIQDAKGYSPLKIRAAIVPAANIGSRAGLPLAIFGFFIASDFMITLGLVLFLGALAFHLVTLPVEFNASRRALTLLDRGGYLNGRELNGARKVLRAAAFTYVAATLVALINLARILILRGRRR